MNGYLNRAMKSKDRRFARIFEKMGKLTTDGASYEKQGTAFDPGAVGHELQGRASAPSETTELTAAEVLAQVSPMKADFMSWKSLATKVLGDDTPARKADIIAALEAKVEAEKGA